MRETIQSGLPTTYTYDVELRRGRPLLVRPHAGGDDGDGLVRFDNLTRRYQLSRVDRRPRRRCRVTERTRKCGRWMTSFERLPLFSTTDLEAERRVLRARPRPHAAAQHLSALAVGRRPMGARHVHVHSLSMATPLRAASSITAGARRRRSRPRPPRRPIRDNPRLLLAGIVVLVAAFVGAARAREPHDQLLAGLPHRGRPLRALGRRPDDARRRWCSSWPATSSSCWSSGGARCRSRGFAPSSSRCCSA